MVVAPYMLAAESESLMARLLRMKTGWSSDLLLKEVIITGVYILSAADMKSANITMFIYTHNDQVNK